MFIIKFNNMIRNKWIWGIFAVIVVGAFVAGDLFSPSGPESFEGNKLDGELVPRADYMLLSRIVDFEARSMENGFENPEREIWKRLAALKAADEMGIAVSEAEIARIIQSDPTFHDQSGAFNEEMYRAALRSVDLDPHFYDQMMRVRIILGRLQSTVSAGAWAAPASVDEVAKGYTDSFIINTAVLSNAFNAAKTEVTDDEVKSYYDKNPAEFTLPDRRQVVYSVFKAVDFRDKIDVSEDEIFDYYDANASMFVKTGTNGVETTQPLEEVRDTIENDLAMQSAKLEAYAAAADFADVFYTNRNASITFESAAAWAGYPVMTSRLFTAESSPVSIEGSPAFVDAAFLLEPGSLTGRFSDAVDGGNESYVMCVITNDPSHVRPFDEVKESARISAMAASAGTKFRSAIDTAVDAIVSGAEAGKQFNELAKEQGMAVSTNFAFTARDAFGPSAFPGADGVAMAMKAMVAGDFSKSPVSVPEGALFFQVVERTPGDQMMYSTVRRQSSVGMHSDLAAMTWDAWLEKNLTSRNPVTEIPIVPLSDAEALPEAEEAE